ncbi:hypothetical protein CDL15_Pgr005268 [Punica granatum]|uniref:Uncharacterized protein n=1 Tax=Punica granatum TaxID=22663 RepID=A0A218XPD9_PUNGR|nr:hypothetical protein CDL15_Pgr005268 [Punica granatum]
MGMSRKVVGTYSKWMTPEQESSRYVPEGDAPEQESSRDIPEGFAICTWRIPNEQHGSKAPTQWTCGVRGALLGGWYVAGKFKVGMDPKGTDPRVEK